MAVKKNLELEIIERIARHLKKVFYHLDRARLLDEKVKNDLDILAMKQAQRIEKDK